MEGQLRTEWDSDNLSDAEYDLKSDLYIVPANNQGGWEVGQQGVSSNGDGTLSVSPDAVSESRSLYIEENSR